MAEVKNKNMDLYEKYREAPITAQKTIGAGRLKGMTDINPQWRIQGLTEAFGPCGKGWYIEITDRWTEAVGDEITANVQLNLYVKYDDGWSKPITGIGGAKLSTVERNGVYVSDECYKMATTDAISVACKYLGFGADIYWAEGRTKYDQATATPADKAQGKAQGRDVMDAYKKPLDAKYINTINSELSRTGVELSKILNTYHVKELKDMTIDQFNSCMKRLKATPDKPKETDTEDEGLPWNTLTRSADGK